MIKHTLQGVKSWEPTLVGIDWQFPKINLMYFPDSQADVTLRKGH